MNRFAAVIIVACSSPTPPPAEHPVASALIADAAPPMTPDAGIPAEVDNAAAWIFRYDAPGRLETWTLRSHDQVATLVIETAQGTTHYVGSMIDGALTVTAGSARLSLNCKPTQLAVGVRCNDAHAKKLDVLDCYHPDFKEPMPFGLAPGITYDANPPCNGYRVIAP